MLYALWATVAFLAVISAIILVPSYRNHWTAFRSDMANDSLAKRTMLVIASPWIMSWKAGETLRPWLLTWPKTITWGRYNLRITLEWWITVTEAVTETNDEGTRVSFREAMSMWWGEFKPRLVSGLRTVAINVALVVLGYGLEKGLLALTGVGMGMFVPVLGYNLWKKHASKEEPTPEPEPEVEPEQQEINDLLNQANQAFEDEQIQQAMDGHTQDAQAEFEAAQEEELDHAQVADAFTAAIMNFADSDDEDEYIELTPEQRASTEKTQEIIEQIEERDYEAEAKAKAIKVCKGNSTTVQNYIKSCDNILVLRAIECIERAKSRKRPHRLVVERITQLTKTAQVEVQG